MQSFYIHFHQHFSIFLNSISIFTRSAKKRMAIKFDIVFLCEHGAATWFGSRFHMVATNSKAKWNETKRKTDLISENKQFFWWVAFQNAVFGEKFNKLKQFCVELSECVLRLVRPFFFLFSVALQQSIQLHAQFQWLNCSTAREKIYCYSYTHTHHSNCARCVSVNGYKSFQSDWSVIVFNAYAHTMREKQNRT